MPSVRSILGCSLPLGLLLGIATSCRAQYSQAVHRIEPAVGSTMVSDAAVAASFRVVLEEIIGDSADRVCLSVADPDATSHTPDDAVDRDPSEEVLRRLRGGRVIVMARSVCAADERNFGPSRGHIRLRGVAQAADGTLTIDADTMGDHFARYRCVARQEEGRVRDASCRITSRD